MIIRRWSHAASPNHADRADFPAPYVVSDITEYRSPIDGRPIGSRSTRREDLRVNDCVAWEPGIGQKAGAKERTPGKYRNPNFAKKRGLPLSEQGMERAKAVKP